ncbi:MAG: hypothetical protein PHY35_04010, partial [Candidatus Omnitrophica bacterium]|nr:hypothetical protein [Candidatus Omnitrophota bacterium]
MKRIKTAFFIFLFLFVSANILYAKEVNIVYTGQTHAMLYPCSCPVQQDGGIARRATLIKQLKKKDPRLFLLDCGSFTAGNLIDEYAQNTLLDMQRSLVNFKAMELMGYDAVGLSQDEFNFGMEYFLKIAKSDKPVFLSANLKSEKVSPYMVKNINGVKIGIIGLTGLYAGNKAGLKVSEPVKKTAELIDQLKAKGVQVIIIISNLGEKEDLKLIAEVKGIDIVFVGQNPLKEEQISKVGSVFVLRPSWQGRKLGKLTLEIKNGILENCKAEQITLSDKIADDPNILKILPRCYSDSNCRKEGFVGVCNNPGDLKAECDFIMPSKITMKVITARDCAVCKSDQVVNSLKRRFPG